MLHVSAGSHVPQMPTYVGDESFIKLRSSDGGLGFACRLLRHAAVCHCARERRDALHPGQFLYYTF